MRGAFEWDTKVAAANLSIHAVSFEEALSVFGAADEVYYTNGSEQFVTGTSRLGNVVTVAYAWFPLDWTPGKPGRCRILYARHASIPERNLRRP